MDHFTTSFNVSHRQAELHRDGALIRAGRKARGRSFFARLRGLWPSESRPAVAEPMATTVPLPIADDDDGSLDTKAA